MHSFPIKILAASRGSMMTFFFPACNVAVPAATGNQSEQDTAILSSLMSLAHRSMTRPRPNWFQSTQPVNWKVIITSLFHFHSLSLSSYFSVYRAGSAIFGAALRYPHHGASLFRLTLCICCIHIYMSLHILSRYNRGYEKDLHLRVWRLMQ